MSQMIEVKVAELVGAALDWAVATAEGLKIYIADPEYGTGYRICVETGLLLFTKRYRPSTDWELGGPLIEKYKVDLHFDGRAWWAQAGTVDTGPLACRHEAVLIAACRSIVAFKSGAVVSVPAELMPR